MLLLRPYQNAAQIELWKFWKAGGGNPLIDVATGLGKSLLIADLCRRFHKHGKRVLVASHIREIITQDVKAIRELWPESEGLIGINSAALGERNTDAPIVCGTVQSIFRNPRALGPRDLVLIDEAHTIPRDGEGMYLSTIAGLRPIRPSMRVAGFTATPYRLDSGRLDEGDDRLFDRVVYHYGIGEAVRDGWLAPLTAKATDSEIDTTGVARRGGEYVAGELEAAADQTGLVAGAAEEIVKCGTGRRAWLAFCCGVDHSFHVRDALRERGVSCETIVGTTPADERAQIIADFRAGKIQCLSNCNCLTTGFDVAAVDLIAMLRPTLSPGLFVQMAGRGTRKADGKQNCLLLDFAGNVMRHGPVDTITGTAISIFGMGEAHAKECPECASLVAPRAKVCPDCGYEWPAPTPILPKHDTRASTLAPLSGEATWLPVLGVEFEEHLKPGRPPSLRVEFWTGQQNILDWLAFEHSNGARWYANQKWRALGGRLPPPQTTDEALERRDELGAVEAIAVRREGEYWRVTGVRLRPVLQPVAP